jgi:hypothetical protein
MFLELHGNYLSMDERKKLVSVTSLSDGDPDHIPVARRHSRCLLPAHPRSGNHSWRSQTGEEIFKPLDILITAR